MALSNSVFEIVSYTVSNPQDPDSAIIRFNPSETIHAGVQFSIVSRVGGMYLKGNPLDLGTNVPPDDRISIYASSVFYTPTAGGTNYLQAPTDRQVYTFPDTARFEDHESLSFRGSLNLNPEVSRIGNNLTLRSFFTVKLSWASPNAETRLAETMPTVPPNTDFHELALEQNTFAELRLPILIPSEVLTHGQ